jgi:hypothetical protein
MTTVDAHTHVFPVVGGTRSEDRRAFLTQDVYGTAFPIGGGFWMTAGHVMKQAAANPSHAIAYPHEGGWGISESADLEILESHDVCIFRNGFGKATLMPWYLGELAMATNVLSVGYPYSLNRDLMTLSIRAFRGSIVAGFTTDHIPAHPRAYELQYSCPRGLSGAPVISEGNALATCGVVVGNASTETNVFTLREVVREGTTTIVERYEAMNVGLAVQTGSLATLRFNVLGRTLEEHLRQHGLVVDAA